jgi:hypothetical protein
VQCSCRIVFANKNVFDMNTEAWSCEKAKPMQLEHQHCHMQPQLCMHEAGMRAERLRQQQGV